MDHSPQITYKTLGEELKRQGFVYRQIFRKGDWAIYEQFRKEPLKRVAYEVVKIRRHNGFTIAGVDIPPAETYPTSSVWGMYGWTYQTYEEAAAGLTRRSNKGLSEHSDDFIEDAEILQEMISESEGDLESL